MRRINKMTKKVFAVVLSVAISISMVDTTGLTTVYAATGTEVGEEGQTSPTGLSDLGNSGEEGESSSEGLGESSNVDENEGGNTSNGDINANPGDGADSNGGAGDGASSNGGAGTGDKSGSSAGSGIEGGNGSEDEDETNPGSDELEEGDESEEESEDLEDSEEDEESDDEDGEEEEGLEDEEDEKFVGYVTYESGNISCDDGTDNEELFKEYVAEELDTYVLDEAYEEIVAEELAEDIPAGEIYSAYSSGSFQLFGYAARSRALTGNEAIVYNYLKPLIKKIADGELARSSFELDLTEEAFSGFEKSVARDTGNTGEPDQTELGAAFNKCVNMDAVVNKLLADCSYELYWFEKTVGYNCGGVFGYDASNIIINKMVINFNIDPTFKLSESEVDRYSLDTSKTSAAKASAAKSAEIVANATSMSDLQKLKYYKDQICSLVKYDDSAAASSSQALKTISPWQIINVFDGDSDTNVVCEGYSKAFAYLCEQTTFSNSSVYAYTVTGTMDGGTGAGGHMWNLVRMPNEKNYLVDVTNCDAGTIGCPDKLFMVGYDGELKDSSKVVGYRETINSKNVDYIYDRDTLSTFDWTNLELSSEDYSEEADPTPTVELTVSEAAIYDGYQIVAGEDFIYNANGHCGEVTYQYKKSSDAEYATGLPRTPGTYTIKANVAEDTTNNNNATSATADITIKYLDIPSDFTGLYYDAKKGGTTYYEGSNNIKYYLGKVYISPLYSGGPEIKISDNPDDPESFVTGFTLFGELNPAESTVKKDFYLMVGDKITDCVAHEEFIYDNADPSVSVQPINNVDVINSVPTFDDIAKFKIEATDDVSGISRLRYRVTKQELAEPFVEVKSWEDIENNKTVEIELNRGDYGFWVEATDGAGNPCVMIYSFKLFGNAPEFSINKKAKIEYTGSPIEFGEGKDIWTSITLVDNSKLSNAKCYYKAKGAEDSAYVEGLPTNIGEYTIKVVIPRNELEYYKESSAVADIAIEKKTVDISLSDAGSIAGKLGAKTTISASATGGGSALALEYSTSDPSVATVDESGEVSFVGIGTADVTIKLQDNAYYTAENKTVTVNVDYATAPVADSIKYNNAAKKDWYGESAVNISLEGYTVSESLNGSYTESVAIPYTADGDNSKNLYFKENATGAKTNAVIVTVKYDHTSPSFPENGGIKIAENSWRTLLNTITFGLVFGNTQTVSVAAEDAGSGIDKYYYYVDKSGSTSALTKEQLDTQTFTEKDSPTIDTISTDDKYVYYVYVTDKVGNKSPYICSDGVVINSVPEIGAPVVEEATLLDTSAVVKVTPTYVGSGISNYYLVKSTSDLSGSITSENIATTDGAISDTDGEINVTDLRQNTTYYYAVAAGTSAGKVSNVKYGSFTTKKLIPTFDAMPTITGTFGKKLSEMTLSKTDETSKNGVAGSWSITDEDRNSIYPVPDGSVGYEVSFAPTTAGASEIYKTTIIPTVAYLATDAVVQVAGTSGANDWYTSNVTLTAPDGFEITDNLDTSDIETTTWGNAISPVTDNGTKEITYYLKNSSGISAAKNITIKKDSVAPSAEISVGTNKWNTFLTTITFGLFFKETKTISISAEDAASGIDKVYYYKTNEAKSEDVIKGLADSNWTEGNSFNVSSDEQFIVYAKAVDKAGNATYISSDGMTYDATAPVVTISATGGAYTGTSSGTDVYDDSANVAISVVETRALDTFTYTIDGGASTPISGTSKNITIDTAGSHVIAVTATDKAGNTDTKSKTVIIYKDAPALTITPAENITFDGESIAEGVDFTVNKNGNSGEIIYSYKTKDAADSTYQSGLPANVGDYTIRGQIAENNSQYLKAIEATADISIARISAEIIVPNTSIEKKLGDAVFNIGASKTGDGTITYASSDTSVADVDASGNVTVKAIGTTTISLNMAETANCAAAATKTVTVTVVYAQAPTSILYNGQAKKNWYNSADGSVLISATGFTVAADIAGPYNESYSIVYTADGEATKKLYFKNAAGQIADGVDVTVNYDHTAPSFDAGGIIIADNTFKSLLSTITFGIIYSEYKDVTVSAADSGSGIDKYYYYIDKTGSETALSAEALAGKSFAATSESKIATISEDSKYVFYVYATDKAGNKSNYICSNGVVLDTVAPTITSLTIPDTSLTDSAARISVSATDNGTGVDNYYLVKGTSDLKASVTKANILDNADKITSSTGSFDLTGLTLNTKYYYAIAAADKAGRVSDVKYGDFTTKKIKITMSSSPTITGVFGQKLSDMILSKSSDTSTNGVAGTWSITQSGAGSIYPLVGSSTGYEVSFIPTSPDDYEPYKVTIVPTVTYHSTGAVATLAGTQSPDSWYLGEISLVAPTGYKVANSLDLATMSATWASSLTLSLDDGLKNIEYYLKADASNEITEKKSISAKVDRMAPTGVITVGASSWNSFISSITFGTKYKTGQTVNITASDLASGVDKISYVKSDSAMTIAQVQALEEDAWTEGNSLRIEPIENAIVYARITDNVGHLTYISTNGMVFDNTPDPEPAPKPTTPSKPSSSINEDLQNWLNNYLGGNGNSNGNIFGNIGGSTNESASSEVSSPAPQQSSSPQPATNVSQAVASQTTTTVAGTASTAAGGQTSVSEAIISNGIPSYTAPEKATISEVVRVNVDGTSTNVALRVDGTVQETSVLPAVAVALNSAGIVNPQAPTVVSSVAIVVDKKDISANAKVDKVTTVVQATTINGSINISPQMVSQLKTTAAGQIGTSVNKTVVDIKVNTLAADGKPLSVTVSSSDLKNNATLKAYALDPVTGGYVMVNVPAVKYNKNTGLTTNGLVGGLEYKYVSSSEARKIDNAIANSVKVSDEFKKPLQTAPGAAVNMATAISPTLNMANVKAIQYSVSGNRAIINPNTGLLVVNQNAKKGTITVNIKVTLQNGKQKTIKAKLKV